MISAAKFHCQDSIQEYENEHLKKFVSRPGTPPSDLEIPQNDSSFENITSCDDILKTLCEFQDGFHLLTSRVKLNLFSTKEAAVFLKKRALIEQEYAKSMMKLAQTSIKPEGKDGSFGDSWNEFVQTHAKIADVHLALSDSVGELSNGLFTLFNDTERSRKQLKAAGYQHAKSLSDSESMLEKQRQKYECQNSEWERSIAAREGSEKTLFPPKKINPLSRSFSVSMTNSLNILRHPHSSSISKLMKYEDETREKVVHANSNLKIQLKKTNDEKMAYFTRHLPRFVKLLKEANDNCDNSLKNALYHYAKLSEDSLKSELDRLGCNLELDDHINGKGFVQMIESIDNLKDFHDYTIHYLDCLELNPCQTFKRNLSDLTLEPHQAHFGRDLTELSERDGEAIPKVVRKCIEFLENKGLRIQGLHRDSCDMKRALNLQDVLDQDPDLFRFEEGSWNSTDVSTVLKLFFRELPDPLFPRELYHPFMDAGRMEDPKRRLIAVHELVNRLNDSGYATLRALCKHFANVQRCQFETKMTSLNLAVAWAPILMDSPDSKVEGKELLYQTRVIETIINHFDHIFEVEDQ